MTFEEVVDQALAMLQRRGRVTCRMLQRHCQLEDAALEDLKEGLMALAYCRQAGGRAVARSAYRQIAHEGGQGLFYGPTACGHRRRPVSHAARLRRAGRGPHHRVRGV